jgi:hypothetical protein
MNRRALLAILLLTAVPARAETRRALLVGIDEYASAPLGSPPPERSFTNLEGAVADAEAMKATLTSRYGFAEKDVVLLKNSDATRGAILAGLEKLVAASAPGDVAVFYYAGHGSQVKNVGSHENDKLDETFVPWDSQSGAADIRDKELGAILVKVKERVQFTFMADSCHSGSITRGPGTMRLRQIAPDPKAQVNDPTQPDASEKVLVLSAAQDYQPAAETTDTDGRPHGAFTAALLRSLNSLPVDAPANAVFLATRERMKAGGFYQEPVLEVPAARKGAPFLGPRTRGASGRPIVAVVKVQAKEVTLRAGTATSVGPNTILARTEPTPLRLRVTAVDFLTCVATAVDPKVSVASLQPGDLFEIEKLAPPRHAALKVQLPAAPPDASAVLAAAKEFGHLNAQDVVWIDDPARTIPTHVVQHDGAGWTLHGPGGRVAALGAEPKATKVREALAKMPPAGNREAPCDKKACLFVRLPPPKQVVTGLGIGKDPGDAIRAVERDADADYALVGRIGAKGSAEYAWVRLVAPPGTCRGASGERIEPGGGSCEARGGHMVEPSSAPPATLPPRSDFVAMGSLRTAQMESAALESQATRIARIAALLRVSAPSSDPAFPYRLAIRKKGGGEPIIGGKLREGAYELVLTADGDLADSPRRRVYVLALQSDGAIHVLYGRNNVENEYPVRGVEPKKLYVLGGPKIDVGAPYGTDTLVLLASADPIQNIGDLEQTEVLASKGISRGAFDVGSLLANEASRTRGFDTAPTANWSIERLEFETVP